MTTETAPRRTERWLGQAEYDRLTAAAKTDRETLLVRLAGESGLRAAEMVRVRPADLRRVRSAPDRHLLAVRGNDGIDRETVVPAELETEIRRYVRENGVDDGEPLIGVSPRRVQMLVSDVASRAADRTGDERYAELSIRDLRKYFAHRLLVDADVNPRVAKAVGGWGSFESLEPYLDPPDEDAVVSALDRLADPTSDHERDRAEAVDGVSSLLADARDCCVFRISEEGYVESWPESAASVLGHDGREVLDRHVSILYTEDAVEQGRPGHHLSEATEEGRYEDAGYRVRDDGDRIWAHVVITPVWRDDFLRGFAVLVVDLTARKRQLDSVRRERDRLQRTRTVADAVCVATEDALDADDRDEIERSVCAALTADAYVGAWFATPDHAGDAVPRTVDGVSDETAAGIADALATAGETQRALASESPVVLAETERESIPDGLREPLRQCGAQSVALVSLTAKETSHGVLCVLSDRPTAFDEDERAHLRTLGRRIGHAITALRRRKRLLSNDVIELAFRVSGDRSVFNRVTSGLDCSLSLESLVAGSDTTLVYYLTLSGTTPPDVFERAKAADHITEFRLVETHDSGYLLEFVLSGSAPSLTLTQAGATVTSLDVDRGDSALTAELAYDADLRSVIDELTESFPAAEFVGKQGVDEADRTVGEFRRGVEDRLTDRQEAALQAAYFGGYFDWPRESTAEEIADAMGVSSPTLHNHLRKGQHELLQTMFETTLEDRE
jgi:PAS domain S-box-containing protein